MGTSINLLLCDLITSLVPTCQNTPAPAIRPPCNSSRSRQFTAMTLITECMVHSENFVLYFKVKKNKLIFDETRQKKQLLAYPHPFSGIYTGFRHLSDLDSRHHSFHRLADRAHFHPAGAGTTKNIPYKYLLKTLLSTGTLRASFQTLFRKSRVHRKEYG